MEDLHCKITMLNFQLSVLEKFKNTTKHNIFPTAETRSTPNSERFTNARTWLSPSKHTISLFHRTPRMNYSWDLISHAYCVWWQSPRLLSLRKVGPLRCCTGLGAIQGPAMCSRVTEAGQAAPVASAVAAAVCPPSAMAEMCGGLLLSSMPLPSHTWASRRPLAHTHKQFHAENHTPLSPKEKEVPAHYLGSRMSNAAECRISPSS